MSISSEQDGRSRGATSLRGRCASALRLTTYLSVVSAGLLYWSVRSAYAEGERAIRRFGEQLVSELGPSLVGTPQLLQVNGQKLLFASKQSELPVRAVLDQFDASCTSSSEALRAQFPMAPGLDPSQPQPPALDRLLRHDPRRFGVFRNEGEHEGQLSCLAQPKDRRGIAALTAAMEELLETGDLSRLGDMRYVTARKLDNGKTQVIAIWSEGEFRLGSLFPESGDAPGTDMQNVPRPPAATRQLSAEAAGQPFGLRLYASKRPLREVLEFYDRELPKLGWEPVRMPVEQGALREGVFVRAFVQGDGAVAIGVDAKRTGSSGVSLIDLGSVRRRTAVSSAALLGSKRPAD